MFLDVSSVNLEMWMKHDPQFRDLVRGWLVDTTFDGNVFQVFKRTIETLWNPEAFVI